MKHRTHRVRRITAAAVLGMGMTAGVIGVTAGVAGAAGATTVTTTPTTNTFQILNPTTAKHAISNIEVSYTASGVAKTMTGISVTVTLTTPHVKWVVGTPAPACTATFAGVGKTCTVAKTSTTKLTVTYTEAATNDTVHSFTLSHLYLATSTTVHGAIDVTVPAANTEAASGPTEIAQAKTAGTLAAVKDLSIPGTVPSDTAGSVTATIPANWKVATTDVLHLGVSATGGGIVKWVAAKDTTSTTHTHIALSGTGTATLKVTFTATQVLTNAIKITGVSFTTTGAAGTIHVTAKLTTKKGTAVTGDEFAPATVVNAKVLAPATTKAASIKELSKTSIGSTSKTAGAGNVKVTFTSAQAGTPYLFLHVSTATGTTVVWKAGAATTVTRVTVLAVTGTGTATLMLTIHTAAKGSSFVVSGITYTNTKSHGTITVTPTLESGTARTTPGTGEAAFSPTGVANASAPAAPAAAPSTTTLASMTTVKTVPVGLGNTNAAANTLTLTFGDASKTTTEVIPAGTVEEFQLNTSSGHNCTSGTNYVEFDGAPKVTLTATSSNHVTGTPKVTVSLARSTAGTHKCATNSKTDLLKITFTNALTLAKNATKAPKAVFVISGVHYSAGSKTTLGYVQLATHTSTIALTTLVTHASNAKVSKAWVVTTKKSVTQSAFDATITPISVVEASASPGTIVSGYVCVKITGKNHRYFNTSATPKVTVAAGNGKVTATAKYLPATLATATTVAFHVTTASTTASTYTVSGLAVNAPATAHTTVDVTVTFGATTTCGIGNRTLTIGKGAIFETGKSSTSIYGATATGTAVQALEHAFPLHTGAKTTCTGLTHTVVLATNKTYQDALSSQYLAKDLATGTLLTGVTSISSTTMNALRIEGIQTVYVVGGPLAVSATVVNTLEATPAYNCGGKTTVTNKTGKTVFLKVVRLYGQTQYGTANAIAQFVGSAPTMNVSAAYAGTNKTGGTGAFNDTAGTGSTHPIKGGTLKTAIVASGQEFQDAMASSVLAYHTKVPTILTPATSLSTTAVAALTNLHIQQVILLGGPLAITNTVAKSIESMGISVLRIAGKDYTDTAVQLGKFEMTSKTTGGLAWNPTGTVIVTRGNGFSDGLVGAVLDSIKEHPLLLIENPTTVGSYLTTFLKLVGHTGINGHKVTALEILGGPKAVTPTVISQMQADL